MYILVYIFNVFSNKLIYPSNKIFLKIVLYIKKKKHLSSKISINLYHNVFSLRYPFFFY